MNVAKDVFDWAVGQPATLWHDAGDFAQDIEEGVDELENHFQPLEDRFTDFVTPTKRPSGNYQGAPRKRPRNDPGPNMSRVRQHGGMEVETDKPHSKTAVEKYAPTVRGILGQNQRYGVLYLNRIELPPQFDDTNDQINRRTTSIFLRGIKIHRHFEGLDVFASEGRGDMGPAVVNWALIQYKCAKDPTDDAGTLAELRTRFFTQANSETQWYHPFQDWLPNANVTNPFDIYDINHIHGTMNQHTDYNILARKRMRISQYFNTTSQSDARKSVARVRAYFKVPQRIYLEGSDNGTWNHPIYEVYWITPINSVNILRNYPSTGTAAHFNTRSQNTVYYRELKH